MAVEDFTTYIEVDPGSDISKTATRITWTNLLRTVDSYVYKDKGVDHFDGDYEHLITVYLDATDIYAMTGYWMLANLVNNYQAIDDGGGDLQAVTLTEASGGTDYRIYLRDVFGGSLSLDSWNDLALDTPYYLRIKRDENVGANGTIYCYIYSDSGRTNLLDTLTVALDEKEDWRYIYGCVSCYTGTPRPQSGYSENLDLQEGALQTISPSSIVSAESFGTPTIIPGVVIISPSAIASLESFGTPAIIPGIVIISPSAIASLESFGTPIVISGLVLYPSSIPSAESFGTPALVYDQTVSPSAIASLESLGTPAIIPGIVIISPSSIASLEAFGMPAILPGVVIISPSAIASMEAFGTPSLKYDQTIYPSAIASLAAFGVPTVILVTRYDQWTDWAVDAYAVALCAHGAAVLAFRIDATDGHLYRCESSDNAENWGSWIDMGYLGASPADYRLAACFKSNGDCIVLYSNGTTLYRRRKLYLSSWFSPTTFNDYYNNWIDEPNAYDDNADTFAASTGPGWLYLRVGDPMERKTATKIRLLCSGLNNPTMDVETWDPDNNWQSIHSGAFTSGQWVEYPIPNSPVEVEVIRIRATHGDVLYVHEADFEDITFTWETAAAWSNSLSSISGIAVTYMGDWNVVVTGVDGDGRSGVWTCVLGNGYSAAVDSWSALKDIMIAESGSGISFCFPSLSMPDVFRMFFVETYSGSESYSRPYWSHSLATADFISNLWREPIPFNLDSDHGLSLCYKSPYVWLSRPARVWRASLLPPFVELTDSLLSVSSKIIPYRGGIDISLRNDDRRFNTLGSGTYEAIKKASEILISWGYHTTSGKETGGFDPTTWIESWEHVTRGGQSEFILHTVDGWDLLERWRARRQFTWSAGSKNIYQLLALIFARAGLELSAFSTSTALVNQYPAFTINPGESGLTAVKRLLAMVPDVIFFVRDTAYLKNPLTGDSSQYAYGTDHAIIEGSYRELAIKANRAQVFGDGVFTEDWDWDEIALVHDRLAQASDINIDSTTKAHQRGDAILRDSDIEGLNGHILVPMNCGQDLFDVVAITSPQAGLNASKRRVISLTRTWTPNKPKSRYSLSVGLGAP